MEKKPIPNKTPPPPNKICIVNNYASKKMPGCVYIEKKPENQEKPKPDIHALTNT